jgi:penicillin-insensitive murein endopeptidase
MAARRALYALVWAAAFVATGCAARQGAFVPSPPATSARPPSANPSRDPSGATTPPAPETDCAPSPVAEEEPESDRSMLDDGFEAPAAAAGPASAAPVPFADLTDADLAARLRTDIGALGSMSIGQAHGGVLVAGVQMPAGANWELVSPGLAWGTRETVDALEHAIDAVATRFPSTPKAFIGNISANRGGHLPPHVSHQSGRDVDLGYYLSEGHRWYATANGSNLDRPRTWHLVRTLIAESDVDLILIDIGVQRTLKSYAREIGEDPAWLDQIFQVGGKSQRPIIFHAKGHATHLHVRFYSPVAQELGRRAYRVLLARHLIAPPTLYVTHTTKAGETLSHLALRYKVTPEAIKKANALANDLVRVNKAYRIPQTGGVPMPGRVALPVRRAPPSPTAVASAPPKRCS